MILGGRDDCRLTVGVASSAVCWLFAGLLWTPAGHGVVSCEVCRTWDARCGQYSSPSTEIPRLCQPLSSDNHKYADNVSAVTDNNN